MLPLLDFGPENQNFLISISPISIYIRISPSRIFKYVENRPLAGLYKHDCGSLNSSGYPPNRMMPNSNEIRTNSDKMSLSSGGIVPNSYRIVLNNYE